MRLDEIMTSGDREAMVILVLRGEKDKSDLFWTMDITSLDTAKISGNILQITGPAELHSVKKNTRKTNFNRGHRQPPQIAIHLDQHYSGELPKAGAVVIPTNQISKIRYLEYNSTGSDIATVFTILGVATLTLAVLLVITVATKSAYCPFIYSETPSGPVLEGELFSGATAIHLERHDWLPLKHMTPVGDTCRIRITNEVKEIQHTNLMELMVVDHPAGTTVLFDKNGNLHTIARPEAPITALNTVGNDVHALIARPDSLRFMGTHEQQNPEAKEDLYFTFKRPANATSAKLVINAKNSMWLDVVHGLFLDEFGTYKSKLEENIAQQSRAELEQWMLDQNMPLSVWLETAPGHWERAGWYNLSGPIALRSDVLPIDLSKVQTDEVRLKLSTGFLFWEIDYVGIDFSDEQPATVQTVPPLSAVDLNGVNHLSEISGDDAAYYHQRQMGEEASVVFVSPAASDPDLKRSWFLHAKGYYEILHDAPKHRPRQKDLKKFEEPNSYPVFAQQKWNELLSQSWSFTQPNSN